MPSRYVVVHEHTLGLIREGGSEVQVLHSSILRGSPHTLQPGIIPIPMNSDHIRDATLQDFEDYRVSPVGHLMESEEGSDDE